MNWKTKDFFEKHYIKDGKSYQQIANMIGVSKPTIIKAAKSVGVRSRSNSESHSVDRDIAHHPF